MDIPCKLKHTMWSHMTSYKSMLYINNLSPTHFSRFCWCLIGLQVMQVQIFLTLKSAWVILLPYSLVHPSNFCLQWIFQAVPVLRAFVHILSVLNNQPHSSVNLSVMSFRCFLYPPHHHSQQLWLGWDVQYLLPGPCNSLKSRFIPWQFTL